jgi:hypothetical protein
VVTGASFIQHVRDHASVAARRLAHFHQDFGNYVRPVWPTGLREGEKCMTYCERLS